MSELFKINAGLTAGLANFPKELSLVELHVDNEQDLIQIKYKEYTVIEGKKIEPVYFKYVLRDPIIHKDRFGVAIQSKDAEGNLEWETVAQHVSIGGVLQYEEDGITPIMEDVVLPKPLLSQFTKWVTAFSSIWENVLEEGIKDHYNL